MKLQNHTRLAAFATAGLLLFATGVAQAYYNPQTGRWLSRDPVCEPGFQVLQAASGVGRSLPASPARVLPQGRWFERDPISEKGNANRYQFVRNDPVDKLDYLGLTVHLSPLNGIVGNRSSAYVYIEGDWVEVYTAGPDWRGTTYPWSYPDYWSAERDPNYTGQADKAGSHILNPGHSSPGDWAAWATRIVDADFITGASQTMYTGPLCCFKAKLPYKIGPFVVHVRDCMFRRTGVWIDGY